MELIFTSTAKLPVSLLCSINHPLLLPPSHRLWLWLTVLFFGPGTGILSLTGETDTNKNEFTAL